MQIITEAKYKEFIEQAMELAKYKDLIEKLQRNLRNKSIQIKQLRSKVDYCKNAHLKKTPNKMSKDNVNTDDISSEKDTKVKASSHPFFGKLKYS